MTRRICNFFNTQSAHSNLLEPLLNPHPGDGGHTDSAEAQVNGSNADAEASMGLETDAERAYVLYKEDFQTPIWDCCIRFCFLSVATDPKRAHLLETLIRIRKVAVYYSMELKFKEYLPKRREGIGRSAVGFVSQGRLDRERDRMVQHRNLLKDLAEFVLDVLPFLYGLRDAPDGENCPSRKFCTKCICGILGISRNFLYHRRKWAPTDRVDDEYLRCLVDAAGIRLQQFRRIGDRRGFPDLKDLPSHECGCEEPCLAQLDVKYLPTECNSFASISRQLKPWQKEYRFLINVMFCPLTNEAVNMCNNAISSWYTVSEAYAAEIRRILNQMGSDPDLEHRSLIENAYQGFLTSKRHPFNRYAAHIREKIESHSDLVLRADPSGASGPNVYRV